jgi:hypothetical protein
MRGGCQDPLRHCRFCRCRVLVARIASTVPKSVQEEIMASSASPPRQARIRAAATPSAAAHRASAHGAADGLLLSAFPILLVFAALKDSGLRQRIGGLIAIGATAMVASLAMTAVYHAGYSDFRGSKLRKPVAGDLVWSVPTLATLNPVGAPIAHVGLHVGAVVHSYDTDLFLPPH